MDEKNRYFGPENRINPADHWFNPNSSTPVNYESNLYNTALSDPSVTFYNDETGESYLNPSQPDLEYEKKMSEFETTIQERFKDELEEEELIFIRKWTNAGLQIVSLITEHLVSHPFVVIRRQCQVNNKLSRYHIVPITLIPIVVNIHRWQGITCLWKGVGSVLVIKGLTLAVQDLVSKITFWPKEISLESSGKNIGKHLLLKCITCAIITPFYSASLLETVQSEIASEKPEFLDVFKEGLRRLISFGYPQKGRMLPVWSLIVPTAVYFIVKHLFTLFLKTVIAKALIFNQEMQHRRQGAIPKNFLTKDHQNIEISSSLVAVLSADIVLFPLETILHRLHLQGTRTIIDDLDNGSSVTPILTNFEGVLDCYNATVREEGYTGLYKGFGALLMQCMAYTSILKLSKFVFTQISYLFCKSESSSYLGAKNINWNKRIPHPVVKPKQSGKIKNRPMYEDLSSDSDEFYDKSVPQFKAF